MIPDSRLVADLAPSPNYGERRERSVDCLVLHYTGMVSGEAALARLCDPASSVSCHYLVWEDGRVTQLVSEAMRGWHAGRSFWAGEQDINSVSIGIEIVNKGHDGGSPPYPPAQIEAVVALSQDIAKRHGIAQKRVLAHSDIAPDRKIDPGEWFPWQRFADAGLGLYTMPEPIIDGPVLKPGDQGSPVLALQNDLRTLGFDVAPNGLYDETTAIAVAAVQRHWRPVLIDGRADLSTVTTLRRLIA